MEEKTYAQMKEEFRLFYHKEVKDKLAEYEQMRKQNVLKLLCVYGIIISTLCAWILGALGIKNYSIIFFILLFVFAGILLIINKFSNKDFFNNTEKVLKNILMKKFLEIFFTNFKWKNSISNKDIPKIQQYLSLNILNKAPFIVFDDMIIGLFRNVSIAIYEANNYTFRGLIVEFQMNKNFEGHTFFLEKSLSAKKIPINSSVFKEVKLEMSEFSKNYTTYSDNQVEARYLLTTAFMERICNLNLAFKAKFVRGAFKDDKLTLAIDCGKDMFAMGSNFKTSSSKTFSQLYDEMISILKIIDELKLNERTGL